MPKIQMKLSIFKALLFQVLNYGQVTTLCTNCDSINIEQHT